MKNNKLDYGYLVIIDGEKRFVIAENIEATFTQVEEGGYDNCEFVHASSIPIFTPKVKNVLEDAGDFNDKYRSYIEEGFYGLAINNLEVVKYLDEEFQKEIESNPDFTLSQIKIKFNFVAVYANTNVPETYIKWRHEIAKILTKTEGRNYQ